MGGANVDAWHYMIQQHGNERCVIVGSSVHNERIERLWQDVHRAVVSPFKELFMRLEREDILDVSNDIDLFCLYKIFTCHINKCLSEFVTSWNNHSISTEHNKLPMQLFIVGHENEELASEMKETLARYMIPFCHRLLRLLK